ncbi:MAG: hypothetical protein ABH828_00235 [archaeon]
MNNYVDVDAKLYHIWSNLCLHKNVKDISQIFAKLKTAYAPYENGFHSLSNHIYPGFKELNKVIDMADFPNALKFAWFFHNSINVPGSKTNREDSISFFYDALKGQGLNDNFFLIVQNDIMATDYVNVEPKTPDEKIMISLDLALLGLPQEQFDRNTGLLRLEHKMYSDEEFKKGVVERFNFFLDKKPIFPIKYFEEKYEAQAKENMTRLIKEYS